MLEGREGDRDGRVATRRLQKNANLIEVLID